MTTYFEVVEYLEKVVDVISEDNIEEILNILNKSPRVEIRAMFESEITQEMFEPEPGEEEPWYNVPEVKAGWNKSLTKLALSHAMTNRIEYGERHVCYHDYLYSGIDYAWNQHQLEVKKQEAALDEMVRTAQENGEYD